MHFQILFGGKMTIFLVSQTWCVRCQPGEREREREREIFVAGHSIHHCIYCSCSSLICSIKIPFQIFIHSYIWFCFSLRSSSAFNVMFIAQHESHSHLPFPSAFSNKKCLNITSTLILILLLLQLLF